MSDDDAGNERQELLTPEGGEDQSAQADLYEERARAELGHYPGHEEGCPDRYTVPFTLSRCRCGPTEPEPDAGEP